jgi:hypothetical protein
MRKQEQLRQLIKQRANGLKLQNKDLDPQVLLAAILYCETKMGTKPRPRTEPAYLPGGSLFDKEAIKNAYEEYGDNIANSYGPWQVPYIVARACGFRHEPTVLEDLETNITSIIEFLNQRIIARGATTLSQIADCLSRNYIDRRVPHTYIRRLIQAYNGKAREWLEGKDL